MKAIWETLTAWSVPAPLILCFVFLFYKVRFKAIPPSDSFAFALSATTSFIGCVKVVLNLTAVQSGDMQAAMTVGALILFYAGVVTFREALRKAIRKRPKLVKDLEENKK